MKRIALLIVLCVTIKAFAQLPERTFAQTVKESYCQYDTLSNYPKQWAEYVGQDIIFLPIDTIYHGLWKDYNCFYCDSLLKTHYISKNTPNKYIDNKRFHVLNCKFISPYKTNYKPGLIFQLLSASNDTIYWHIPYFLDNNSITNNYYHPVMDERNEKRLPVLIDSYIKRIQEYIGQKFIAKNDIRKQEFRLAASDQLNDYEMVDINTGNEINIAKNQVFTCVDVTLLPTNEQFKQPFLIFKDSLNNEFRVSFMDFGGVQYDIHHRLWINRFYTESEWASLINEREQRANEEKALNERHLQECVKLFGKNKGAIIAQGKVQIGMTAKMCKYAWGEPDNITRAGTSFGTAEQWFYNCLPHLGKSLYFTNGILTAIQE